MSTQNLIDTHCHLTSKKHFPDVGKVVAEAGAAGVTRLITVGTDIEDARAAIAIAEEYEGVYAEIGFHPNYTKGYTKEWLVELRDLLQHPKVVALGEIGLDYHWDYSPKETQFRALHDQLDLAMELDKPVVFHSREANDDLLTVLEERTRQPYLIHCFSGGRPEAVRAIALGCLMGLDGPVTYKRNDELRSLVTEFGLEHFVLETDSPYLAPEPYRGKDNAPKYVPFIRDVVARAAGVTSKEVAEQTTLNAERFFRLPLAKKSG